MAPWSRESLDASVSGSVFVSGTRYRLNHGCFPLMIVFAWFVRLVISLHSKHKGRSVVFAARTPTHGRAKQCLANC